jgi:hypothetical protein
VFVLKTDVIKVFTCVFIIKSLVVIIFTKVIFTKSLVVIVFTKVLYSSLAARKSFLGADKGSTETDRKGTDYFTILSSNIIKALIVFLYPTSL